MAIEMNEVRFAAPTAIDGYGPGGFRVGGHWNDGAVFVAAEQMVPWAVAPDGPKPEDFAPLMTYIEGLDVVLLGLGVEQRVVDPAVHALFDARGIGLEPMATPSAARTFNVLLGEGRRVAAALIPV